MIRVRHCLFFLFLSLSSPFPFLFPFPSFTLPFPFPFPRSCEFFDQGAKPALGKTIIGKKNDDMWKNHLKGLGVFTTRRAGRSSRVSLGVHDQISCVLQYMVFVLLEFRRAKRINFLKAQFTCIYIYIHLYIYIVTAYTSYKSI